MLFTGSSEIVNPSNGDYESLITSRMDKDGVYTSCDHKMRSKETPNFARVSKESIKDVNYQALVSVNMDHLDVYASIQKSITAQEKPHLRESKNLETNQSDDIQTL